ncbi:hypothetical protein BZA05DRAFT_103353 [Tricharina praecox]|uniref:uncharacterized protein n=1 Tax=Tricharina praecox TaxID=43433 RepID=UPI002220CC70|nr:uncharacterized protein BZA05DRAFT_103353 [Tricharina praecox]KAI5857690.1 hypothetical protein BZA05DRAFT_103353 [Tricharina praecox]
MCRDKALQKTCRRYSSLVALCGRQYGERISPSPHPSQVPHSALSTATETPSHSPPPTAKNTHGAHRALRDPGEVSNTTHHHSLASFPQLILPSTCRSLSHDRYRRPQNSPSLHQQSELQNDCHKVTTQSTPLRHPFFPHTSKCYSCPTGFCIVRQVITQTARLYLSRTCYLTAPLHPLFRLAFLSSSVVPCHRASKHPRTAVTVCTTSSSKVYIPQS